MTDKLRVGIIGCRGIALGKHLPSLAKLGHIEVTAFCDIVKEKAISAAKQYGSETARVYEDYRELVSDAGVDVVHVCTPNDSHAEITVAALEAGKHVMCEKPMAITSMDGRKMIEAAKRTGKKLTIGYQNRFRADSQYLHQVCKEDGLGHIYFAKAHALRRRGVPTWGVFLDEQKQGGGPLIDIGTHALDLALWMMNNYEPKVVLGSSHHELSKFEHAANAWGAWDPKKFTVEDSAFGFIVMKNGATIILESSWALNTLDIGEAQCSLSGTKAGADMRGGLHIHGEQYGKLYTSDVQLQGAGADFFEGHTDNAADLEMKMWIEAVMLDKEPLVKPEEALVVTEILEAIYQSAHTGEAVYFS